jgi:hypothetical protein
MTVRTINLINELGIVSPLVPDSEKAWMLRLLKVEAINTSQQPAPHSRVWTFASVSRILKGHNLSAITISETAPP